MSLKRHILVFFSNQKLVIKGNNSCQKQYFKEIALLNVNNDQRKTALRLLLQPDL